MTPTPFTLIIPAAGSGSRMGYSHNKLFILLGQKPVLWHTLRAFESCPGLEEIILAVRVGEETVLDALLEREAFSRPIRYAAGGATRQESVWNALQAVRPSSEAVWVHDGARPFIGRDVIGRLLQLPEDRRNAIVAVPAKDTIKRVDRNGIVTDTPDRNGLWLVQTPQVFKRAQLADAYEKAIAAGFAGTDDASLMSWAGYPVCVIEGNYFNIKITTPEDLVLAESIQKHLEKELNPCV